MRPHADPRPARRSRQQPARHPLPLALALALAAPLAHAQAPPPGTLPGGGNVVNGSATITLPGGNVMNIGQTTRGAIIDWGTFSIGSGGTVNFNQPTGGVTLNRVVGTPAGGLQTSQIFGNLNATGRVFLVNPSGIVFGAGSQVNVGGLVASTLDIANGDFIAGVDSGSFTFNATSPGASQIQNLGNLVANAQGTIALLAGTVTNAGTVTADGGTVALASSQQVTLDFFGDGLTQVTIGLGTDDGGLRNLGVLQADGGRVELRTQTDDGAPGGFGGFIEQAGVVRARSVANRNGRIVLDAGAGDVRVGFFNAAGVTTTTGATLDATGIDAGETGGTISVAGGSVQIVGARENNAACNVNAQCTLFDVSGNSGGGTIEVDSASDFFIGGDGGSDTVDSSVKFLADTVNGTAGTISLVNTDDPDDIDAPFLLSGDIAVSASGLGAGSRGGLVRVTSNGGSISVVDEVGENFFGIADFAADGGSGGGTIDFDATDEIQIGQGTLLSTTSSGAVGGVINISGDTIEINGTPANGECQVGGGCTIIDASGSAGGGSIEISSVYTTVISSPEIPGSFGVQIRSDALSSGGGGTITLTNIGAPRDQIPGGIFVNGSTLVSASGANNGIGGDVLIASDAAEIELRNIISDGDTGPINVVADGGNGGGRIEVNAASNLLMLGTSLSADANVSGTGGLVRTIAGDRLDVFVVDVSAGGTIAAGTWEIQSGRGLAIVDGSAQFGPVGGVSLIPDNSIGDALSAGTNVAITVPAAGNGTFPQINIAPGVAIANTGALPVALSLTAAGGQVLAGVNPDGTVGAWSIGSSVGPLDLRIDALSSVGLFQGSVQTNGGDIDLVSRNSSTFGVEVNATTLDSGGGDVDIASLVSVGDGVDIIDSTINTDGGALTLRALDSGADGVSVVESTLDTRVGQNAANAGGALTIEGNSRGEEGFNAGVLLDDSNLRGSTGAIAITGRSNGTFDGDQATGVLVDGGEIVSGSGAIAVTGIAIAAAGSGANARGTSIDGATVSSVSGDIALTGYGGIGALPSLGLGIGDQAAAQIATGGAISLSGSSQLGSGIVIGTGSSVSGDEQVVLRARGGAGQDSLVIDGTIASATAVNLRPGAVDLAGVASDSVDDAIVLGGASGFALSTAELANIATPNLVIGHAGHAGAITVAGALARTGNLTLQNTGGDGGIALNAGVTVGGTLALASGGDITQTAAGGISAQSLLVRSTGGSVDLTAAQNDVSGNTLAGGAAGDFGYVDINTLAIGNVEAVGFDAAGQANTLAESGVDAADAVLVRNNAGDLTLGANVSGTDVDLVTAGRLQNAAGATITAGNRFRVWADTWIGEQRGGLLGSGPLPNLFNCSFGGPCGVTVSADDNHFIYRQQPVATILVDDAFREYGLDNPAFIFEILGRVFDDDIEGNIASGTLSTSADIFSDVGTYAIDGSFSSAAGYAIQVDPGTLSVTPATLTYVADPLTLLFGQLFGGFTGTVTGFRNGDTLDLDTIGTLLFSTTVGPDAPPGVYPILGSGLDAGNYDFVQDPANFTALRVNPAPLTELPDVIRLPPETYVYNSNIGTVALCPITGEQVATRTQDGDVLAREWGKVRSRPNLTSCVSSERKNSCGDF